MYTTCLHCHDDLGRNESLELFPVGRRLAFDQAKGRLWVICTACARWNLSPLDERWEAIEACEKLYRDTRKRVATEQMGLAKITDDLTLVRIGRPLFPEYASWRYTGRFAARRRRSRILGAAAGVSGLALFAGASVLGFGGFAFQFAFGLPRAIREIIEARRILGRLELPGAPPLEVRGNLAGAARLVSPRTGGLIVELDRITARAGGVGKALPFQRLEKEQARAFLRLAMPYANRKGASPKEVEEGVTQTGLGAAPVDPLAASHAVLARHGYAFSLVRDIPTPLRVGLEMAVMEDQERRWMETELHLLEASWQEAEELAAIADSLTLPEWVTEKLGRLRGNDGQVGG